MKQFPGISMQSLSRLLVGSLGTVITNVTGCGRLATRASASMRDGNLACWMADCDPIYTPKWLVPADCCDGDMALGNPHMRRVIT